MNENKSKIQLSDTTTGHISEKVMQAAHVCRVPSTDNNVHRYIENKLIFLAVLSKFCFGI